MSRTMVTTALGFVGTAIIFLTLFWLVGFEEIALEISKIDKLYVGLMLILGSLWLVSWGMSLRTVLSALGHKTSVISSVLMYSGAAFSNNITPFGQAGGEPVSALIISKQIDSDYSIGLASIASVDIINFVPSSIFIVVGLLYYTTEIALGDGIIISIVFGTVSLLIVPPMLILIWKKRKRIEEIIAIIVTYTSKSLSKFTSHETYSKEDVIKRVNKFFSSVSEVSTQPRMLSIALVYSTLGWALKAASLWVAIIAVGSSAPFSALLFIVPIGGVASISPLPGGAGGIEPVLIGLVASFTPVSLAAATVAVVIHRSIIYWLPIIVGGSFVATKGIKL